MLCPAPRRPIRVHYVVVPSPVIRCALLCTALRALPGSTLHCHSVPYPPPVRASLCCEYKAFRLSRLWLAVLRWAAQSSAPLGPAVLRFATVLYPVIPSVLSCALKRCAALCEAWPRCNKRRSVFRYSPSVLSFASHRHASQSPARPCRAVPCCIISYPSRPHAFALLCNTQPSTARPCFAVLRRTRHRSATYSMSQSSHPYAFAVPSHAGPSHARQHIAGPCNATILTQPSCACPCFPSR